MPSDVVVIRAENLSRFFSIRKDKSLKERLVNARRSREHRDQFWALRDINFEITSGTTLGLVGPNGSGKSTLLKTIGGILQPSSGTVARRGRLAALLELGAGFHPDLTGRENVFLNASILGLSQKQTNEYFDAIVDFSGISEFIDTQVKFYSSGMYVRLAFAVAVHVDPDILLVDEVLAVGDEPFQKKCMRRMRDFQEDGRTIVLVSHSLSQVSELCDRAIVLERGKMLADGPPAEALPVLREHFAAETPAPVAMVDEEPEPAEGPRALHATVAAVEVTNGGSSRAAAISPGDPVSVILEVEAAEDIPGWWVGFEIEAPDGYILYGEDTRNLQVDLGVLHEGRRRVEFTIPHLYLAGGEYYVSASVGAGADQTVSRVPQAAPLSVAGARSGFGTVAMQTNAKLS